MTVRERSDLAVWLLVRDIGRAAGRTTIRREDLYRAVFDALTDAGVITDDARIVQVAAVKQESTTDAGLTVYGKQIEEEP